MLYYLGKGTEFKKEDCKEYKTIEGALKAAAKNEELVVWDENGNVIGSLTNNVPEGALETNPDGSVNTYNADGNKVGTMTAEELKAATTLTDEKDAEGQQGDAGASTDDENGGTGGNTPVEPENGQNGANSEQENGQQTSGDGDDAAGQETSGDDERKAEEQVWDENGNVIGSLTNNVPEGALETNPDGSVNTYNADGNKVGTMTAEELKAATTLTDEKDAEGQQGDAGASTDDENGGTGGNTPVEPENGQNGANSEQENGQQTSGDGDDAAGQETSGDDERKAEEQVSDSDTIYPEKTTRAIVDCDGALNLRRSASWGNESICGRAVRGQSYYIKAIHTVEGKKMLETIDGIFLSGQPEHVRIIEV